MQVMKPEAAHSWVECELRNGQPLSLTGAKGRRVRCLAGIVWITAVCHPADVFLKPGEIFVIPNDGLVLAEAVGQGRMQLDAPRSLHYSASRFPSRLRRAWQGMQAALGRLALPVLQLLRSGRQRGVDSC